MRHWRGIVVGTVLILCTVAIAETPEEKGLRIARENEKFHAGFGGETSTMEMVLINAHGDEVRRKMKSRVKEASQDGDKSLIEFVWPADVQGTRMLTWSHKQGDDDQWLYLPSIKRIKRISSRSKSGSFMGSEFSYEDLGSREVEQYKFKYLRDEDVDGRKCWVMETIPVYERSGYSRMVNWIDQEYRTTRKVEFYDLKGELLKTLVAQKFMQFLTYWRATEIEMSNQQTQKRSRLIWTERKLPTTLSDDEFKSENMENP